MNAAQYAIPAVILLALGLFQLRKIRDDTDKGSQ